MSSVTCTMHTASQQGSSAVLPPALAAAGCCMRGHVGPLGLSKVGERLWRTMKTLCSMRQAPKNCTQLGSNSAPHVTQPTICPLQD